MKLFFVAEGTKGILFRKINSSCTRKTGDYTISRDIHFDREDMILDPIKLQNKTYIGDKYGTTPEMFDLVKKGYAIFSEPGTMGYSKKFYIAVPYKEIKIDQCP